MMHSIPEDERRKYLRRKVFLGGNVAIHGDQALPCIIKDLTPDGARLIFSPSTTLPSRFRFELPSKQCIMVGQIIWQRDDVVGIQFEGFDHGSQDAITFELSDAGQRWSN